MEPLVARQSYVTIDELMLAVSGYVFLVRMIITDRYLPLMKSPTVGIETGQL